MSCSHSTYLVVPMFLFPRAYYQVVFKSTFTIVWLVRLQCTDPFIFLASIAEIPAVANGLNADIIWDIHGKELL